MKYTIMLTAIMLAFGAQAQEVTGTATNNATTTATSAAQNAGNAQSINFNSRNDGTSTLKTAPNLGGLGGYAGFSPENCPNAEGFQLSTIALAGSYIGPRKNDSCDSRMTVRSIGQSAASVSNPSDKAGLERVMLGKTCLIDAETFELMVEQGLCTASSIRLARVKFQPENARQQNTSPYPP